MSRPEKPIDWDKVDQLLMAGCLGTEIAPHFDIHPTNFYTRVQDKHGMGFTEYCQLKRQQGDSLLKFKQFEKAMQGDNTLLIWLGKSRLKQKEDPSAIEVDQSILSLYNQLMQQIGEMQNIEAQKLPEFKQDLISNSSE